MSIGNRRCTVVAALLATLAGGTALAAEKYEVAVIRWAPEDIYFNGVQLGQEMECDRIMKEDGVEIEFRVFGANDVSAQRNALDALISRGVDGVLMVPWRGEAMRGVVNQLHDDGIPVVISNNMVPGARQTFVAFDNETAGRQGAEALVKRLTELRGADWADKGGVIIELRCVITASADIDRHDGYRSVLDPIVAEHSGVSVEVNEAGCAGGKARKAVDDIIARHGPEQILAVISIDGTMGVGGAVPAFQAQGMLVPPDDPKHIPIITIDGTMPELEALERGHIDTVMVQPAFGEGIMSMRLLYDMMKSGKMLEAPAEPQKLYADGDELWMPVEVLPFDQFDGPWYRIQTYGVPHDVSPKDPRNWAVQMSEQGAAQPEGAN
ncbi:MAG TPA: sugar ABC transporter substrate-binding protein [Geminicoccus sp.]|uniref:sugar ABC transporter substrate-binding protein n=1 Tax=Geminicoccus sp. TaxID=2024832 RepID=UPI002C39F619|nr:sugar ABC transporter substrate-binding protein [Geminicoccus sp.]HWL70026.1 sugar ABC transporter substrate-binding protein [Geminicoccus sp.]